ncbi:MAG: lipoyl(octanoyl) transferase LipB [Phycisphaerales bacterium]|nr:lipoyl(octanoyl) transferase LipB [Phycisphaerales bacterium]
MLRTSVALPVIDLGVMDYRSAYAHQIRHLEEVQGARVAGMGDAGRILLVEHAPPVITISNRPQAARHLLANEDQLRRAGVTVEATDRGGDITYHGPGQLVVYPIIDLQHLGLGLHPYMRLLEEAIIRTSAHFGVKAGRDTCATGVWVGGGEAIDATEREAAAGGGPEAITCAGLRRSGRKIAAIGVRVRKWVTMHGLALNVTTNLAYFDLIVPCGLPGRAVTSLERELGADRCPPMQQVKDRLVAELTALLAA